MPEELFGLATEAAKQLASEGRLNDDMFNFIKTTTGDAVATFRECIESDSSFGYLRDGWIQTKHWGYPVHKGAFAGFLLSCELGGSLVGDHLSLVASARAFATHGTSTVSTFFPIAGLKADREMTFSDGTSLLPTTAPMTGKHKEKFLGGDERVRKDTRKATAFIRRQDPAVKVLFASQEQANRVQDTVKAKKPTKTRDHFHILDDFVSCAIAYVSSPVVVLGEWSAADEVWARALEPGSPVHFLREFYDAMQLPGCDVNEIEFRALYDGWIALDESEKAALGISMKRLSQGMLRSDFVDRIIDIGIALEVLFLHNIDTPTELTFRLSARAANFLGGTRVERDKRFKLLKEVYALRSQAVHRGSIGDKEIGAAWAKMLEAVSICATAARTIATRRVFPDWDKEFIIGQD